MASAHALRLISALEQWAFIGALLRFLPAYMVAGSLIWGTLGLVLALGLWRGYTWADRTLKIASLLYSLYYWLDRFLLSTAPPNNLPFAAVLNTAILIIIFWILTRRKTKLFFGATYGDRPQNS